MAVKAQLTGPLTALQVMQDAPVIPVIVLTDVSQAVAMAKALRPKRDNRYSERWAAFSTRLVSLP